MLNLKLSVTSVLAFDIFSVNEKLIGPITENQSIPIPIELLTLSLQLMLSHRSAPILVGQVVG